MITWINTIVQKTPKIVAMTTSLDKIDFSTWITQRVYRDTYIHVSIIYVSTTTQTPSTHKSIEQWYCSLHNKYTCDQLACHVSMTGSHFTLKTHTTRIHMGILYSLPFYYGLLVWTLCSFPTTCSCSTSPLYILYFKFHHYLPIFTLTLIAHDLPSVNLCALLRSTKAWVYNFTLYQPISANYTLWI